jgi:hypothetical protein
MDDFSFNRPIPGESLTAELGARPWQNPPQFSTVDDALAYYLPRMGQKDFAKGLIDVMETGFPLTNLANVIMLSGVMEGKHSVDVGILTIPAIIETMQLIGDSAGVKYTTGLEESEGEISNSKIKKVLSKQIEEENGNTVQEEIAPTISKEESEPEEKPMGLMSRRDTNV